MKRKREIPAHLKSLYAEIAPYVRILRYASITWMDGHEIGMAPASGRRKKKYPILLWIYKYESVDEMANTIAHEVVHYVHPDLEDNEPAVEARTTGLMKNPIWELLVLYKLLHSVHVSLKEKFKENERFTLG